MTLFFDASVIYCMPHEDPSKSTKEVSPTEQNRHMNEVPMPQQKTDDAKRPPDELPHLSDGMPSEQTPDHPPSERA